MFEHLSMSERIDRIGVLLAKAVYVFHKGQEAEKDGTGEKEEGVGNN